MRNAIKVFFVLAISLAITGVLFRENSAILSGMVIALLSAKELFGSNSSREQSTVESKIKDSLVSHLGLRRLFYKVEVYSSALRITPRFGKSEESVIYPEYLRTVDEKVISGVGIRNEALFEKLGIGVVFEAEDLAILSCGGKTINIKAQPLYEFDGCESWEFARHALFFAI